MRTFPKLLAASALVAQAVLGSAAAAAAASGDAAASGHGAASGHAAGEHKPSASAGEAGHRLVSELLGSDLTSYVAGGRGQGAPA
ncbi:hypothetical protein [Streptomyces sp. NPDC059398]|uniref:hypothetical protein n=1 Tax=Streptomyces sp. NPDC059398 TaxID=3346820 RepID=UPI0036997150